MHFQDIFETLPFLYFTVGVRRPIDDLLPENQPGSGAISLESLTSDQYGNKREGLQSYLEFIFNCIQNISHRSGYRALDPDLSRTGSATLTSTLARSRPVI